MRHLRIVSLMMLSLMAASIVAAQPYPPVFETLSWTEMRPAAIQAESILADEPTGRPVVGPDEKDIWITGKQYLWKWSLLDGAMSRWDAPQEKHSNFRLLYVDNRILVGVDSRSAWMLDLSKKSWRKLDGMFPPNCAASLAYPLPPDGSHRLYFINNCGIFLILIKPGQLVATSGIHLKPDGEQPPFFVGIPGQGNILTLDDRNLIHVRLDGPRLREDTVYSAKSKLKGVVRSGRHVLAWTSQALIVFDENLKRQQVVPVLGTRKIRAVGATDSIHVVSLSDGTVELMHLGARRKWASSTADYFPQFIDVLLDNTLVMLSSESGLPRVFRLAAGNGVTHIP